MIKLNNKGMTTVEILISFVLVAAISTMLFSTVANYNNKRQVESDKLEINEYKNVLTKVIQDDIIKVGMQSASTYQKRSDDGVKDIYVADIVLKNGKRKRLVVERALVDNEKASADSFGVYYGETSSTNIKDCSTDKLEKFPLPDLGSTTKDGKTLQNLKISNVIFSTENYTLSIFIGLYHNDIGSRYAINIVAPINN